MITRAVLVSFDGTAYTAAVRPSGSPARTLAGIPVSRGIPSAEMTAGRTVALAWFTPGDPGDAVVVAVW